MGSQRVGHDWATFTFTLPQYTLGILGGRGDPGIVKPGLTLQWCLYIISTCVQQFPKQNLVPGTKWNKLRLQNMKKENETYHQLRHHQILFISFSKSLLKSPTVIADDWVIVVLVECTPNTNMKSQHGKHFATFFIRLDDKLRKEGSRWCSWQTCRNWRCFCVLQVVYMASALCFMYSGYIL